MTQNEFESAINIVIDLVQEFGGFAEYLLRFELAAHGIVLDNDEIIETLEAALARVDFFAEGVVFPERDLLIMPVKGNA